MGSMISCIHNFKNNIYILEEEPRLGYNDFIVKKNIHWFGGGIGTNTIEKNVFEVDNNNHRMNTKGSE
jgi:hypothetical protein